MNDTLCLQNSRENSASPFCQKNMAMADAWNLLYDNDVKLFTCEMEKEMSLLLAI